MKTTRRNIALLIGLCSFCTITVRAAEPPPNVIFIAIDDLNDWPKFMGRYPDAITPNMDRSSRTPMVIVGPGVTAGQRCDRVVSLLDIYPTLVDLCSLPTNPKCEGRSLRRKSGIAQAIGPNAAV